MVLDPGSVVIPGQLFTFNNPSTISDPNVNRYPSGNQFNNNGLTGNSINYNENGYTTIDIKYLKPNGVASTAQGVTIVNTGATTSYKYKAGVEYFQVMTGMTRSEVNSIAAGTTNGLLRRYLLDYKVGYQCEEDDQTDGDDHAQATVSHFYKQGDTNENDLVIVFATRGVDPYSPKQKMKYDLSKLFGYETSSGEFDDWANEVTVEGEYYLNIPIQPNVLTGENTATPLITMDMVETDLVPKRYITHLILLILVIAGKITNPFLPNVLTNTFL
jgi:hypothetical protein